MEHHRGVFRQPRQDYVFECDGSASQYLFNGDSLCHVSDFDVPHVQHNLPNVATFQSSDRAVLWVYNQMPYDQRDIILKTQDSTQPSKPSTKSEAKPASGYNSRRTQRVPSAARMIKSLKLLGMMTKLKDEPRTKHLEIKYHNEYMNLEHISAANSMVSVKEYAPPNKDIFCYFENTLKDPESMLNIYRKKKFAEVLSRQRLVEEQRQDTSHMDSACQWDNTATRTEMGTQVDVKHADKDMQTEFVIMTESEERLLQPDEVMDLLKNTTAKIEVKDNVGFSKYSVYRMGSDAEKTNKGTQMFEHVTENDLYTLDWIHYNLFKINVNPYNLIVDEKIQDVSENTTFSDEVMSSSIYV